MGEHDQTRYAKSGDLSIAYQVTGGNGPLDVVFVPGFVSHVELRWEVPGLAATHTRLGSFARLVAFDKRGTGLSDREGGIPSLEERMDDVRAVMDAAGVEQAALIGISEGGPLAMMFAATYPERVRALVLWGSYAKIVRADDQPDGVDQEAVDALIATVAERWGSGRVISAFIQGVEGDEYQRLRERVERNAASPGAAVTLLRMAAQIDARHVAGAVRAPTLVVHRTGDRLTPVACGRRLAEQIPDARFVELPGEFHIGARPGMDDDALDAIEEFVTGRRPDAMAAGDRVLATVLFVDIVDSTGHAAALGDRRWRDRLDLFDAGVRDEVTSGRGRVVDTAGDGTLAVFDGPARAVYAAHAIGQRAEGLGLQIRAGVHTGETEVRGDDVAGIAVHIGSRVAGAAAPGEILVSSTVKDLVAGSGLRFEDRGEWELRGVPDRWRLHVAAPLGNTRPLR